MSQPRLPIEKLPHWPLYLPLNLAAAYLGVSPVMFAYEVKLGIWPAPRLRGPKGGLATWDRTLLDAAARREAGFRLSEAGAGDAPHPTVSDEEIRRRFSAKTPPRRSQKSS